MRIDILTLFPEYIDYILSESIIGRARKAGKLDVRTHNIRDYSEDKHRRVDDTPYGGGRGMLMAAPPIYRCIEAVRESGRCESAAEHPHVVYLSPRGRVFNESVAKEYAEKDQLILLCGHYEGVDERVIEECVDEELSLGDFVLTGGELPACIVADCVGRLCDGVLTLPECHEKESFEDDLLEYPQYTRPPVWRGREVPEVLLSGHHANIEAWRREKQLEITKERRPDLYARLPEPPPPKKKRKKRHASPAESEASEEEGTIAPQTESFAAEAETAELPALPQTEIGDNAVCDSGGK